MNKSLKKRLAARFLSVCLLVSQSTVPVSAYAGKTALSARKRRRLQGPCPCLPAR